MDREDKIIALKAYREGELELTRLQEEIARWKRKRKQLSGGKKAEEESEQAKLAGRMIRSLKQRETQRLRQMVIFRQNFEELVGSGMDQKLGLVLRYRYLEGLTFERIGQRMGYGQRWVRRLHEKALSMLELD